MMAFRPAQLGQYQPPTTYSSVDCVPAATARLINRSTVDALNPSHADVRKASGVTDRRGLSYNEASTAAAHFGVTATPRYGITRADLRDILVSGRAVVISIHCAVTVNTPYRTNSYTGDHSIYGQSYNATHDTFEIEDPGTTTAGYLDWPADLVYRAAESRTGGHGINVLVGPDTEGVAWKAIDDAAIRTEPSYTTGKTLRRLKIGETLKGGRTEAGGKWQRKDGTYGKGWVHVQVGTHWFWVKGVAVKEAA